MYTSMKDFESRWAEESETTLKLFKNLTEQSLNQYVYQGGRTLGDIAWHIVITLSEMLSHIGIQLPGPEEDSPAPANIQNYIDAYHLGSKAIIDTLSQKWNDAMLAEEVEIYGQKWTRGYLLEILVTHQVHHRGQMTVLMRQAGLKVPGVCGPSKDDWLAMGREPLK